MNVTASVTESMNTGTLRRGFLGNNDDASVVTPYELKVIYNNRTEEIKEQREALYDELGRPNKKKFKTKFKGREHLLGKNQYIAKRYFDLSQEIESIKSKAVKVNGWMKERGLRDSPTNFDLLSMALFEVLSDEDARLVVERFNKIKTSKAYDECEWSSFLSEIEG